jgi:hypothetical protein
MKYAFISLSAIIILTMFFANKCNAQIIVTTNNNDTIVKFKSFISKFKPLSLPLELNTSYFGHIIGISEDLDMGNDSIFLDGYIGPAITIGMFPDTTDVYAVLYCVAAANYYPCIATYTKTGRLINFQRISSGCGAGMGYKCSEKIIINSSNDITTIFDESYYDTDSLGNNIINSRERTIDIYQYAIDSNGFINVIHKRCE